ncbi:hypothetical protein [Agreia sp. VKM Ac-1783]|uniref:hypothetical protein n=1 Tax=Agreia sp. VKM Ac-1783 TaxID=1938889 RepID=UPI000A2AE931|nr:hypothetical protein [Agreia sp. VKM Ac-1783]SMQ73479.1 hypothetical protein SAMN06295943_2891 [Agreia sp. VKM Ac-1783]
MALGKWLTVEQIEDLWEDDAPSEPKLTMVVRAARSDCRRYAMVPIDTLNDDDEEQGDLIASFHDAQFMQTKNTWNASRVDADGGTGEGDFIVRPFPLDWQVKAKLRPKGGAPAIG